MDFLLLLWFIRFIWKEFRIYARNHSKFCAWSLSSQLCPSALSCRAALLLRALCILQCGSDTCLGLFKRELSSIFTAAPSSRDYGGLSAPRRQIHRASALARANEQPRNAAIQKTCAGCSSACQAAIWRCLPSHYRRRPALLVPQHVRFKHVFNSCTLC